ncbi:ArsR family transcriptional regulator [Candidatus Gracilibacteria bacterium]|nr:ArsR family transcriptional regulator [Candidatus Gracilibacteria bacterium]MCF7819133.1 ArsR family transcriptional regulator [Candidatus Gracilibacteria bacterium]
MYEKVFAQFGFSKNEAIIYEALLREGELSVGDIAQKTQVHRRNVYDSLKRLIEKGVVFEILSPHENMYQAVDPHKFREFIQEKQDMLDRVLPALDKLYASVPHKDDVFVYRGPEGWKNYMRDMIRVGETAYFIGAKGMWLDERVKHFFPHFSEELKEKKLDFYHLFDAEVETECPEIIPYVGKKYKFLPAKYSTKAAIDIFGDHVNILSNGVIGGFGQEFSFTVIVNQDIADAFKTWFQLLWDLCPEPKKNSK